MQDFFWKDSTILGFDIFFGFFLVLVNQLTVDSGIVSREGYVALADDVAKFILKTAKIIETFFLHLHSHHKNPTFDPTIFPRIFDMEFPISDRLFAPDAHKCKSIMNLFWRKIFYIRTNYQPRRYKLKTEGQTYVYLKVSRP